MNEVLDPILSIDQTSESPYLSAALSIADQLVREAIPTKVGVTWSSDDYEGIDESSLKIVHRPVGADLYSGAVGIAWFLAHIAKLTNDATYAKTAEEGLKFALNSINTLDDSANINLSNIALYSGATGVSLAVIEAANCLNSKDLYKAGVNLAKQVANQVIAEPSMMEYDLISGNAGVILGLLSVYRHSMDALLLKACHASSVQLIRGQQKNWFGGAWYPSHNSAPALCGLGHGASGAGWALSEMAWLTKNQAYLTAANAAFQYERSWFSPEHSAWPDLREYNSASMQKQQWPGWTNAWCHGAFGIGAVRLRLYEATQNITALAEASAAIQAARMFIAQAGVSLKQGNNIVDTTLCHGLSGAVELLLLAHEVLGGQDHLRAARYTGDLCFDHYNANAKSWTLGLRGAKKIPGLFLGLAGVGTTMLRLHNPETVQSPMLVGRMARNR